MNTKTIIESLCVAILAVSLFSCSKGDCDPVQSNNRIMKTEERIYEEKSNSIFDLMLQASTDKDLVSSMHQEALSSLDVGLEESIYFSEILNDSSISTKGTFSKRRLREYILSNLISTDTITKSNLSNDIFTINDVEIYWPYSEDWDGLSQPVVVSNRNDESQYIEDDKTWAYRLTREEKGDGYFIDSLIVDEEYAEHSPVWVINRSDVSLQDILGLKHQDYGKTNYVPRHIASQNDVSTKAIGAHVSQLTVVSIKSTKQHDDWLNGGSEYVIYWFFPTGTPEFELATHKTNQIKISRRDIKKGKVRTLSFPGNYDWDAGQSYNRMKVIEFDPGKDYEYDIALRSTYKKDNLDLSGEFKTKIKLNRQDDFIMDFTISRKAMMTVETKKGENYYEKVFEQYGVTILTSLNAIETVEEI